MARLVCYPLKVNKEAGHIVSYRTTSSDILFIAYLVCFPIARLEFLL